jgi:hypothetical protein
MPKVAPSLAPGSSLVLTNALACYTYLISINVKILEVVAQWTNNCLNISRFGVQAEPLLLALRDRERESE